MAIEVTKQPSGGKPTASAEASHTKGAAKPDSADAGSGAGGVFASLLSALDDSGTPLAPDTSAPLPGDSQAAGAMPAQGPGDLKLAPDAGAQGIGVMLSQSMLMAGGHAERSPVDGGSLPVDSALQAKTKSATPVSAANLRDGKVEQAELLKGQLAQRSDLDALPPDTAPEKPGRQASRQNPLFSLKGIEVSASNSIANQVMQDAKLQQHAMREIQSAAVNVSPMPPQLSGVTEAIVKKSERTLEAQTRHAGPDGLAASQGHLVSTRMDTAAPTTEASAVFPQMMAVAEQVSYWAGKDVQNAELKLDGMGATPVEVSVSVQGNEAHVSFRAEQLETRQMLEGAAPQLKDLLQREGLVLSGMSVGTSGANGPGQQQGRERQRQQQATVVLPELTALDAGVRPRPGAGRAVDLFV